MQAGARSTDRTTNRSRAPAAATSAATRTAQAPSRSGDGDQVVDQRTFTRYGFFSAFELAALSSKGLEFAVAVLAGDHEVTQVHLADLGLPAVPGHRVPWRVRVGRSAASTFSLSRRFGTRPAIRCAVSADCSNGVVSQAGCAPHHCPKAEHILAVTVLAN